MRRSRPLPPSAPRSPDPCDRRGLPLSTSPEAAACYREAIERVLGAEAGADALLERAVAVDPRFALAHAARWMEAHAAGDGARAGSARQAALGSLEGLSPWERSHVECLAALIERAPEAWAKARAHLAAHPLDLVIVSQLIGDLFFHGGPGKRAAVLSVLGPLEPHHRDDWAFLARLGFHASELGDPEGAIPILERALAARPRAPFVAHAMAHALLEAGRREASHRFLLDWVARNDPAGPIDGHIHWHLALGELEAGAPAAAVERYLRSSAPGVSRCAAGLLLADAAGLFFRMVLDGVPVDGMPRRELHALLVRLRRALKIPFVAVHAAAMAVALGDEEALRYLGEMGPLLGASATGAHLRVLDALGAYLVGDARACVEALERDRAAAWEALGGSNEERALVERLHASARARLASSTAPPAPAGA